MVHLHVLETDALLNLGTALKATDQTTLDTLGT